jgi:peptidoglycan hydrolase-like protein with peptidoglycan-binding domain
VSSTPDPGASSPGEDLATSGRWRQSIERSRARRLAEAVKRRRRFRSRGAILSMAAVMAVGAVAAGVATGHTGTVPTGTYLTTGSEGSAVSAVEEALGVPVDGYFDEQLYGSVRSFQTENGLLVDGIVGPETSGALGLSAPAAAPAPTAPSESSASGDPALEAIAQCESGGDPSAVSSDGTYRGKYQFSQETWESLGGTGDPAAAPEATQDELAAQLYAQSGTSAWPSCG